MAISTIVDDPIELKDKLLSNILPSFQPQAYKLQSFPQKVGCTITRVQLIRDATTFWAYVITNPNTTDASKVNIFHHPSPNQHGKAKGTHIAPDSSYEDFSPGWEEIGMSYAMTMGLQHTCSAVSFPLVIPMMRLSAFTAPSPDNHIFAAQPVETLNALLRAGTTFKNATLGAAISTSSFSNGIVYHAQTMNFLVNRVVQCVDYDSHYIKGRSNNIGPGTNRMIIRYSQTPDPAPATRNHVLPDPRWPKEMKLNGKSLSSDQLHHMICWSCHMDAMMVGPLT